MVSVILFCYLSLVFLRFFPMIKPHRKGEYKQQFLCYKGSNAKSSISYFYVLRKNIRPIAMYRRLHR